MYRQGVSGVCSPECLRALQDKARAKRKRRQLHKERRVRYGRRLPGATRDRVRKRDGNICRVCQKNTNAMQIHHIVYRSQGGSDAVHNLITLCAVHHALMHSSKVKWQPVCLAVIWICYVENRYVTVPEALKICHKLGLVEREARA